MFVQAAYPAFFALYPAFEKSHKIRALQYANGVRPLPLWMAHLAFDFATVLVASTALTVTIAMQFASFWTAPGYIFVVSCLYGLACILVSYHMARLAGSQLAAFFAAFGVMLLMFVVTALAFTVRPSSAPLPAIVLTLPETKTAHTGLQQS